MSKVNSGPLTPCPSPSRGEGSFFIRMRSAPPLPFRERGLGGEGCPATTRLCTCPAHDPRQQKRYWLGVDVAVEVVSADDPDRDIRVKRSDYAEAGIPEYWIVNPLNHTMTVLTLRGTTYLEYGIFQRGELATSKLIAGFSVNVDAVFDAK